MTSAIAIDLDSDFDQPIANAQIGPRFNGPPGIANGGIVCSLIAEHCGAGFEAELRRPAPLGRDLRVHRNPHGEVGLFDGDEVVAVGRPARLDLDVPEPPSWLEAERAHTRAMASAHPFPHCFVCGPAREAGDGLRVICGAVEHRDGLVAAPWQPDLQFVDDHDGRIPRRLLWAALDCPGGLAALAGRADPILLARFRGELFRRPAAGETCMLMGWSIEHDGRKHRAGTALLGRDGDILGRAEALWIEPRPATKQAKATTLHAA